MKNIRFNKLKILKASKIVGNLIVGGLLINSGLVIGFDNTNINKINKYSNSFLEKEEKNNLYCPAVYEPVKCKVYVKGNFIREITGSNECVVRNKIIKKLINSNISPDDVKLECKKIMEEERNTYRNKYEYNYSYGEPQYKIGKKEQDKLLDRILLVDKPLEYMNSKEITAVLLGYVSKEGIKKIIEVKDKKKGLVRTVFILNKRNLVVKTSNKFIAEILKKEGFKVKDWGTWNELKRKMIEKKKKISTNNEKRIEIMNKIREISKNKRQFEEKIMAKNKELKEKVRQIKERAIREIKEKKRLDIETKKEIIRLIKEKFKLKLDILELKVINLIENQTNEDKELLELINVLEENKNVSINESNTIEDKYEEIISEIEELKKEVDNANSIWDLRRLIIEYINLKNEIKTITGK